MKFEQTKFKYFPLDKNFNKALGESGKKGLLKAIESKKGKQINEINDWGKNKSKAIKKDSKTISRITKNVPNLLMERVKSH